MYLIYQGLKNIKTKKKKKERTIEQRIFEKSLLYKVWFSILEKSVMQHINFIITRIYYYNYYDC